MSLQETLAVAGATFLLTILFTAPLIGWLRDRQIGKAIRVDGPAHQAKAGTPTMGGLGMLAAIILAGAYLAFRRDPACAAAAATPAATAGPAFVLLPLAAMLAFAALGVVDDLAGLARQGRIRELGVGLTARRMLALQAAVALLIGLAVPGLVGAAGWLAVVLVAVTVVAVVGTANGANMSDGLDGLAAGLAALAYAALALVIHLIATPVDQGACWSPGSGLALAVTGACLAFLVFNRHPARVFMGNVASLPLGAGLATLAMLHGVWAWLLLPVIGAVYVAEVLSDILQVAYFKRTGGKRIFRMAPIHHHFELGGWPETKVVHRFWLAGLLAALIGIGIAAVVRVYIVLASALEYLDKLGVD